MVDYAETLRVTPTTVLPKKISKNAFVHEFEDGKTKAVNLSGAKCDAEMQWDYISEADRETILDWYHDSAKANGMARTFYWEDPKSGRTYEARFMGPLRTSFVPGNLQSVDKIAVRLNITGIFHGVSAVCEVLASICSMSTGVGLNGVSAISETTSTDGAITIGISIQGVAAISEVTSTPGSLYAGPYNRLTEDGDYRITEDGYYRITEEI